MSTVTLLEPLKQVRRDLRVPVTRFSQRARYWAWSPVGLPSVFAVTMPKTGSHLLSQFLEGLTLLGPFVVRYLRPVRRLTEAGVARDAEAIAADIEQLVPGDTAFGYVHATPRNRAAMQDPTRLAFYLYRDPRDKIVSHIHYATEMHAGHRMRDFYREETPTMDEKIAATIRGVDDERFELPDIRTNYENYLGWLEVKNVLGVRFEDLIMIRDSTLRVMLDHLESLGYSFGMPREKAIEVLNEAMSPKHSPTYRSGKSGNWQDAFSEENKALFKDVSGDLLIRLGYEQDNNW